MRTAPLPSFAEKKPARVADLCHRPIVESIRKLAQSPVSEKRAQSSRAPSTLEDEGYEVVTAGTGGEGLAVAKERVPDLVAEALALDPAIAAAAERDAWRIGPETGEMRRAA